MRVAPVSRAMPLLLMIATTAATGYAPTKCGLGEKSMVSSYGEQILKECGSGSCTPLAEYPRPQMTRDSFHILNGFWEWEPVAVDPEAELPPRPGSPPVGKTLNGTILVPFPVESCLSGVPIALQRVQQKAMWYRLVFDAPSAEMAAVGTTTVTKLHFGAVDWMSAVWVNGAKLGEHTGGYDSFSFTLQSLKPTGNELLVWAYDPSDAGPQPQGKQRVGAIANPGGDHYTSSSGIWQPVWMELVPTEHIVSLKTRADLTHLHLLVNATGDATFTAVVAGTSVKASGTTGTLLSIEIPQPKLWSPSSPHLYNFTVTLAGGGDSVGSYFGMRTFTLGTEQVKPGPPPPPSPAIPRAVNMDHGGGDLPGWASGKQLATEAACAAACANTTGCLFYVYEPASCGSGKMPGPRCWLKSDLRPGVHKQCRISGPIKPMPYSPPGPTKRPFLNGNFTFAAGWLDQSWWPDGQYTAPTDEGLRSDIVAVKTFGLNMVRLHQKVNSERWYYWADKLGVMIYQDAVQHFGGNPSLELFTDDLEKMIASRYSHPSIVQWDIFNEGDCIRNFMAANPKTPSNLVDLVRKIDPSRLVDVNSGGPGNGHGWGDVNDIHDYPQPRDPKPTPTQCKSRLTRCLNHAFVRASQ